MFANWWKNIIKTQTPQTIYLKDYKPQQF